MIFGENLRLPITIISSVRCFDLYSSILYKANAEAMLYDGVLVVYTENF